MFEDLEQQAAGLHLAERDAELLDRARGEYATVSFASRVHASLGRAVLLALAGGIVVEGRLSQAGADWCLVESSGGHLVWLVRLDAVVTAHGLSDRAVPEAARPAVARLRFGSAVHRLADDSPVLHLHTKAASGLAVRVVRIGADFVEVEPAGDTRAGSVLVPFGAIEAVRKG